MLPLHAGKKKNTVIVENLQLLCLTEHRVCPNFGLRQPCFTVLALSYSKTHTHTHTQKTRVREMYTQNALCLGKLSSVCKNNNCIVPLGFLLWEIRVASPTPPHPPPPGAGGGGAAATEPRDPTYGAG